MRAMTAKNELLFPWACPSCGAKANAHGRGRCNGLRDTACLGFICDMCDGGPHHGQSLTDPCDSAVCHHCGWSGRYPKAAGKVLPWEKTALAAGWLPPVERRKELLGEQQKPARKGKAK